MKKKLMAIVLIVILTLGLTACGGSEVKALNEYLAGKTFVIENWQKTDGARCVWEDLIVFNEDGTADMIEYIGTAVIGETELRQETYTQHFGAYSGVMEDGQLQLCLYLDKKSRGHEWWTMRVRTQGDGSYIIESKNHSGNLEEVPAGTEVPTKDYSYLMNEVNGGANDSSNKTSGSFTNKYGSSSTTCAVSGCSNKIASSGDTNCCTSHSNKCLECRCYIDRDAMYCMSCLKKALYQRTISQGTTLGE